jgi:HNH endonuclease
LAHCSKLTITYLKHGGTSDEENLWLACPMCNGHKSDRIDAIDPETGVTVPIFNPRREQWDSHFEWVEDGTVIRGKTPVGRATVAVLQMNHPDVVAARGLWVEVGWHPPED